MKFNKHKICAYLQKLCMSILWGHTSSAGTYNQGSKIYILARNQKALKKNWLLEWQFYSQFRQTLLKSKSFETLNIYSPYLVMSKYFVAKTKTTLLSQTFKVQKIKYLYFFHFCPALSKRALDQYFEMSVCLFMCLSVTNFQASDWSSWLLLTVVLASHLSD